MPNCDIIIATAVEAVKPFSVNLFVLTLVLTFNPFINDCDMISLNY